MVEWSITPVLKTGVPRGTGGSNPSLSANINQIDKEYPTGVPFLYDATQVYLRIASYKKEIVASETYLFDVCKGSAASG